MEHTGGARGPTREGSGQRELGRVFAVPVASNGGWYRRTQSLLVIGPYWRSLAPSLQRQHPLESGVSAPVTRQATHTYKQPSTQYIGVRKQGITRIPLLNAPGQ